MSKTSETSIEMPVTCARRGDKWRVIEASNRRIARNRGGTALDGGGHSSESACNSQAIAVNASLPKGYSVHTLSEKDED